MGFRGDLARFSDEAATLAGWRLARLTGQTTSTMTLTLLRYDVSTGQITTVLIAIK